MLAIHAQAVKARAQKEPLITRKKKLHDPSWWVRTRDQPTLRP
jgi:hypothetical protein